jgi:DNA-binding SARP family transcriptional activator
MATELSATCAERARRPGSPTEPLCIRLFGSLELTRGGRRLAPFPTRKARSVFCYLLLYVERTHARDLLAGRFWGDQVEYAARRQLSNELWRIRRVLASDRDAAALRVEEDRVGIKLHPDTHLDTSAFQETLRATAHRRAEELTPMEAQRLEDAVALYRGDLLEEVYEDWCDQERQRLPALALDALFRATCYHLHRQDWSAALKHGQRLLRADPLNEPVHAAMMRCHFGSGNRAAALRQYASCIQLLREELDVEPMPETVAVYEHIRTGATLAPAGDAPALQDVTRSAATAAADALARLQTAERDLRRAYTLLDHALRTIHSITDQILPDD